MARVSYMTVGSNKLEAAKVFYDGLLGSIGMKGVYEHPSGGRLYRGKGTGLFGVLGPHDGQPACVGNGMMGGFDFESREEVLMNLLLIELESFAGVERAAPDFAAAVEVGVGGAGDVVHVGLTAGERKRDERAEGESEAAFHLGRRMWGMEWGRTGDTRGARSRTPSLCRRTGSASMRR